MDLSKNTHRNQNHIMTKILAWAIFGSFAILASIICIKYFPNQDFFGIKSTKNTFMQTGLSVIAYIAMPAINIILIYSTTSVLRKENKLNINPLYTTIATIFINLLVIMTLSEADLLLQTKTPIAELVSTNFITTSIITTSVFLFLNLKFETKNPKPVLMAIINTIAGAIISIPIMITIISTPAQDRLNSISSIASATSSFLIIFIACLLTLVLLIVSICGENI